MPSPRRTAARKNPDASAAPDRLSREARVLDGYRTFGGEHWETASVRNVLAFHDVRAPHTGQPFTEALLLGLGGGIGAGYFVFQYGNESSFFVGTRGLWNEVHGAFADAIVKRVGGKAAFAETASRKKALATLVDDLNDGTPVVTWVNLLSLPYEVATPSHKAHFYYTVVVCGANADRTAFSIDDRAPMPWTVPADALADARGSIAAQKNRTMTIAPPRKVADLRKSITAGVRDCVAGLRRPKMANFGLAALKKWSELITSTKDKKGWPNAFPPGPNLFRALYYTYYWIEAAGTGGGGFRGMFADFLVESAAILGNKALLPIADRYRSLAGMWTELAEMALPDDVPMLARARKLTQQKRELIRRKGPDAAAEIARLAGELEDLTKSAGAEFEAIDPNARSAMNAAAALALFDHMRRQIIAIHDAEDAALAALEAAMS